MIFYTNDLEDIANIPSTYTVLLLSTNIREPHPNSRVFICNADLTYSNNKKEAEKKFMKKLKEQYKTQIASIVHLSEKADSCNSIVLVGDAHYNKTVACCNQTKIICKYIEKRYGCKCFKFTNDILRETRMQTKLSSDGYLKLASDILKIVEDRK